MANPLKEIIDLLNKPVETKIGTVTATDGQKCLIKLSDQSYVNAWGSYSRGSTVYIRDDQIMGKVKRQGTVNVLVD
jgi:hypothetical protein